MNNTGNDKQPSRKSIDDDAPDTKRSPVLLVLIAVVLVVCLLIGLQAFGILYSIVFPPTPALPSDLTEVRHTPIDHGVDEWLYRTHQDGCEIVEFYTSLGGECRIVADMCSAELSSQVPLSASGQHVATCVGEVQFNIFAYRWEANIAEGYPFEDGKTQYSLLREVFWTGAVPPRLDPRTGFTWGD